MKDVREIFVRVKLQRRAKYTTPLAKPQKLYTVIFVEKFSGADEHEERWEGFKHFVGT